MKKMLLLLTLFASISFAKGSYNLTYIKNVDIDIKPQSLGFKHLGVRISYYCDKSTNTVWAFVNERKDNGSIVNSFQVTHSLVDKNGNVLGMVNKSCPKEK